MEPTARKPTKRELAKIRTTERAINAAQRLWITPGSYNTYGTRDIAKHMGMSTGAIFSAFKGKDDLWRAAFGTEPPVDSILTRAAPELLEKLKRLTFMARTSGGTAGADAALMEACEQSEAAIAKATGESQ